MITKLTPAQERDLIETRAAWLKIGRSCEPIDKPAATEAICKLYAEGGKKRPVVFFFSSPMTCILAYGVLRSRTPKLELEKANLGANLRANLGDNLRDNLGANLWDNLGANLRANLGDNLWDNLGDNLGANLWDNLGANLWDNLGDNLWDNLGDNLGANLWDNLGANLWDNLGDNLWDNLWDNLGANLWDNLRDNLWANLRDNLWDNLWDNLGANLWDNLRDNLWANLRDNLRANLGDNLGDQVNNAFAGNWWCAWEVHFDFCQRIGLKYTDAQALRLALWIEQSRQCHWWFPYEGIVLASDRPEELHLDERGRMSNQNGMAIKYRDGWGAYFISGISMEPWMVETHSSKLDVAKVLSVKNVDQRRELIRRIGVERLPHKVLHKQGDYELWSVDLTAELKGCRYLKMLNPSVPGVFHVEGVSNDCKTVQHALNWRRYKDTDRQWNPLQLT